MQARKLYEIHHKTQRVSDISHNDLMLSMVVLITKLMTMATEIKARVQVTCWLNTQITHSAFCFSC